MTDAVWQIERRRRELGLSQDRLAGFAGISPGHYRTIIKREHAPRRATIAKLKIALARFEKGEAPKFPSLVYRLCLAVVCQSAGVAIDDVLTQVPSRRATFDPDWLRASKLRERALYLAHAYCGIPQAQLASAAGLTNAAVSLAMGRVEDGCEPDEDPLFRLIETAIGGL